MKKLELRAWLIQALPHIVDELSTVIKHTKSSPHYRCTPRKHGWTFTDTFSKASIRIVDVETKLQLEKMVEELHNKDVYQEYLNLRDAHNPANGVDLSTYC